jgi:competence protein ComEA
MSSGASRRLWVFITAGLLTVIVAGVIIMILRFPRSPVIEISLPPPQEYLTDVVVSGAVNNPGIYSLYRTDTIAGLLNAAGGLTEGADTTKIILTFPYQERNEEVQKIDINRAESWLLEALPGIGATLAQRIIVYREQYGPFQNINEITRVKSMTLNTYEKIKDYITVTD